DLPAIGARAEAGAGAQRALAFIDPLDAGLGVVGDVEGEEAVVALADRHEERISDNGRLAAHGDRLREGDAPGEVELGQILAAEADPGWIEATRIVEVEAEGGDSRGGAEVRGSARSRAPHGRDPAIVRRV